MSNSRTNRRKLRLAQLKELRRVADPYYYYPRKARNKKNKAARKARRVNRE